MIIIRIGLGITTVQGCSTTLAASGTGGRTRAPTQPIMFLHQTRGSNLSDADPDTDALELRPSTVFYDTGNKVRTSLYAEGMRPNTS